MANITRRDLMISATDRCAGAARVAAMAHAGPGGEFSGEEHPVRHSLRAGRRVRHLCARRHAGDGEISPAQGEHRAAQRRFRRGKPRRRPGLPGAARRLHDHDPEHSGHVHPAGPAGHDRFRPQPVHLDRRDGRRREILHQRRPELSAEDLRRSEAALRAASRETLCHRTGRHGLHGGCRREHS